MAPEPTPLRRTDAEPQDRPDAESETERPESPPPANDTGSPARAAEVDRAPVEGGFRKRVEEAQALLAFASANGRLVDDATIKQIADTLTLIAAGAAITADARTAFEKGYAKLAVTLAPITVETLRATDDTQGRTFWGNTKISDARIWSRKLMLLSALVAAFILFSENISRIIQDEDLAANTFGKWHDAWVVVAGILQSLTPFAYGLFGACAYLLRACQKYIHKREFNPHYIPEYFTRLLLGGVSGAAILMFTEAMLTGDGAVKISASALAFIAGYSNDFLFSFIERVIGALMPKAATTSGPPKQETTPQETAS